MDASHLQCVASGYEDLLVHLHSVLKMPGRGKCVFNCDWVLDCAYKDWLQVELRNAVRNASQNSAVSNRGNRKRKRTRKNMKQTGLSLKTCPL